MVVAASDNAIFLAQYLTVKRSTGNLIY